MTWYYDTASVGTVKIEFAGGKVVSIALRDAAGEIALDAPLRGEVIYPATSRQIWPRLRRLVRDLRLPVETEDEAHHLLVTKWVPYQRRDLPDARALGLPNGLVPGAFQFYLYVAPKLEPARVAVGSILEVTVQGARPRGVPDSSAMVYGNDALAGWFLKQLSDRAGAQPEALGRRPERRASQSAALLPSGVQSPCATSPAAPLRGVEIDRAAVKPPRAVSRVMPMYPRYELDQDRGGVVVVEGEVTEHGTIANLRHIKPEDVSEDFKAAALRAAALWRFEPAMLSGCPIRTLAILEMKFAPR